MEHKYRGWEITHNPKPIPTRNDDWEAVHEDYDGPEDGRCITGRSVIDLQLQIDELESEG